MGEVNQPLKLLGISKRGDSYLRTLLIHGGRAVVKAAEGKDDAQSRWINELVSRRNKNIAAVAVAKGDRGLVLVAAWQCRAVERV